MNRDDIVETLKREFSEEIREALLESEQNRGKIVDYDKLNKKIEQAWRAAKLAGLTADDFADVIENVIPEHLESVTFLKTHAA